MAAAAAEGLQPAEMLSVSAGCDAESQFLQELRREAQAFQAPELHWGEALGRGR